jgi:hypothetical protein
MTPTTRLSRRMLLTGSAAAAMLALTGTRVSAASPMPRMQVWKDPSCGCCKDWIALLQKDGFAVETIDTGNTAVRARLKLPMKYGSCHTGLIDGYVVEGHVPMKDIRRLLKERPADAIGIAVPGMPVGSPGMDGPEYKGRRDPYDVLLVTKDGGARIWSSYR